MSARFESPVLVPPPEISVSCHPRFALAALHFRCQRHSKLRSIQLVGLFSPPSGPT
jgi:hypothetical protein